MKNFLALLLVATIPASGALPDTSYPTSDRQSVRIDMTVQPSFPPTLIVNGVTQGQVRIRINVNHLGILTDSLVVAYTHEALARSALAAIERWKFDPMLVRGQAVPSQVELHFAFEATGVVISLNPSITMARLTNQQERFVYGPCQLQELDRIPTPLLANAPHFPGELVDRGMRGQVVVEFFIDEAGTVRMPVVVSAEHEELGFFAIDAVRDWRFEPPTRNGRPVLARIRQEFNFRKAAVGVTQNN